MDAPAGRDRWFEDSSLERDRFEPSVPLHILTVSGPPLVGSVTVPFAKTITARVIATHGSISTRPVTRSSSPSSQVRTGVGATSTKHRFEDRFMITALMASGISSSPAR